MDRSMDKMESMAPGYRFYPTEEELIVFYLRNKLEGEKHEMDRIIPVVDIYDYSPSQLPQLSGEANLRDSEQWFFFIRRQESEARGGRPRRLTGTGYWKATGSPNHVYSSDNRIIGMKRTMVFYSGRAPHGKKTDWKMNEYKAIDTNSQPSSSSANAPPLPTLRQEFSLCRVYKKSKCLRAFDRRPPPGRDVTYPTAASVQNAQESHQVGASTTSYYNNHHNNNNDSTPPPAQMGERSSAVSSPDSSCSEDRGQMELDDNDPFLSWEQVDRFLGSPEP